MTPYLIGGLVLGIVSTLYLLWTLPARSRSDDHLFLNNLLKALVLPIVFGPALGAYLYALIFLVPWKEMTRS